MTGATHDQSANKVLHQVTTKVEILVGRSELCQVESKLLLSEWSLSKVVLLQSRGWIFCSKSSTLVGMSSQCMIAVCLVSSAVSWSVTRKDTNSQMYILLDLVDEVQLDAVRWHPIDHTLFLRLIIVELGVSLIAVILDDIDNSIVLETTVQRHIDDFRVPWPPDVQFATRH